MPVEPRNSHASTHSTSACTISDTSQAGSVENRPKTGSSFREESACGDAMRDRGDIRVANFGFRNAVEEAGHDTKLYK
ncbi:hypothetical protein JCM19992_03560 [Thermostilla marina]